MVVTATPKGNWKDAIHCNVHDGGTGQNFNNVPIFHKFPKSSTEDFSIQWTQLPILILNEISDPDNNQPIDTNLPNFNEIRGPASPARVNMAQNVGWPNGVIIMP
jgi:hypothetical protein